MAAGGTPSNVTLGPGRLYFAPLGTAEPTSASAALPSAWKAIGYTEDGTEISTNITSTAIEVAEELDPIDFVQTMRTTQLSLQMVESTVSRLALAMGAGAAVADGAVAFEPPDPSAIVSVMLVWDSNEDPTTPTGATGNRRWIFRRCTPSGTATRTNRKAPAKRGVTATFDCARDASGEPPFIAYPNSAGLV